MKREKSRMMKALEVKTTDGRFKNRSVQISSLPDGLYHTKIAVPDNEVVCNSCNRNLYTEKGFLVYRELKNDQAYDLYCKKCLKRYFPKAEVINGNPQITVKCCL